MNNCGIVLIRSGAEGQTEWMSAKRNDLNDFGTTAAVALVRVTNGKPTQIVVGNTGMLSDSIDWLLSTGKGIASLNSRF